MISTGASPPPPPPCAPPPSAPHLSDADLEMQARAMAEKALPASLPEAVRIEKMPTVMQKILDRLRKQREEARIKAQKEAIKAKEKADEESRMAQKKAEDEAKAKAQKESSLSFLLSLGAAEHTSLPPPPTETAPAKLEPEQPALPAKVVAQAAAAEVTARILKVEGVDLCGDEPWFTDPAIRGRLQVSVAEAHKEHKILVGQPVSEVGRICPVDGRILGAGAVLRLGGAHLGGYGESDVAFAYRQLSRVVHPDRNPNVAGAPAAFRRLTAAADELRTLLREQRAALDAIIAAMGGALSEELTIRPQEALFAEACRMLSVVCGLLGEGWVPDVAENRAVAALAGSTAGLQPKLLLKEWQVSTSLLELYGTTALRSAYDCAPKHLRAQFLCFLDRAVAAEARIVGGGDCVRGSWKLVLTTFPELGLWRALRQGIRQRVWDEGDANADAIVVSAIITHPRSRSRSRSSDSRGPDPKRAISKHPETCEKVTKWARKWRTAMAAILPSGLDGALSASDPEIRKLAKAMWKDVALWAAAGDEVEAEAGRGLELFRADHGQRGPPRGLPADAPPAEWSFIPMSDLLLIVGEGLVGITAEGVFAKNRRGYKPKSLACCYKKA